jgi:hypothetical protein
MSSPLSPELLNAIEAGCDGVTPGPWAVMRDKFHFDSLTDIRSEVGQFIASTGGTWEYMEPNAAHIARLDPATARELVAGYRRGLAPVKIKPLEWRWIEYGFPPLWSAVTRIAVYDVEEVSGSDGPSYDALRGVVNIGNYEDPDLAKAACQRDHETRIRSALEAPHV